MKVKIVGNIFFVIAKTQYELTISFMRLQEFYESSFPEIQGHHFTTEQHMDRYAEEFGNFTYTSDWNGFNIPGHAVIKFFKEFSDLTNHEKELKNLLDPALSRKKKTAFYVIGYCQNDEKILDHEIAHAMYYLVTGYATAMDKIIDNMSLLSRKLINKKLKNLGYGTNVVKDEIQAYLATSSVWEIIKMFKILPLPTILEARETYHRFKKQKESKANKA